MKFLAIFCLSIFIISCTSNTNSKVPEVSEKKMTTSFKRLPPKKVNPIIIGNIEYSASMNKIIATDTLEKVIKWEKSIYEIAYDENLESDVQDIHIDSISLLDNSLLIRNEESKYFLLNLNNREIKQKTK